MVYLFRSWDVPHDMLLCTVAVKYQQFTLIFNLLMDMGRAEEYVHTHVIVRTCIYHNHQSRNHTTYHFHDMVPVSCNFSINLKRWLPYTHRNIDYRKPFSQLKSTETYKFYSWQECYRMTRFPRKIFDLILSTTLTMWSALATDDGVHEGSFHSKLLSTAALADGVLWAVCRSTSHLAYSTKSGIALPNVALYCCTVLYCTVLYCTEPYRAVLYCSLLYHCYDWARNMFPTNIEVIPW